MAWYWVALLVGVVAPWLFMAPAIRGGFSAGIMPGLGAWLGAAVLTVPAVFVLAWAGQALLG